MSAPQHNTDISRQYRRNRDSGAVTLDASILSALTELGGGPIAWAEVRAQLPRSRYWRPIEALVRLHQSGRVHAVKHAGATFVTAL